MAYEPIKPKANVIAALAENMTENSWASDLIAQSSMIIEAAQEIQRIAKQRAGGNDNTEHRNISMNAITNAPEPLNDDEMMKLTNFMMTLKGEVTLVAEYTNYRGEHSVRTFTPKKVWHGSTDWHPEPGLMLTAFDHEKGAMRDFALTDFDMSTLRQA